MRSANILLCVMALALCQCGKKDNHAHNAPGGTQVTPDPNDNTPAQTPLQPPGPMFRGRVDNRDPAGPYMAWPNTAVALSFTGSSLSATFVDQAGTQNGSPADSMFDVIIDGNTLTPPLTLEPNKQVYPLAANLGPGQHSAWLIRRTEADTGLAQFLGFTLPPDGNVLSPPQLFGRRIEFVGDSEFPGYGVEASVTYQNMCTFTAATENADASVPKLTADLLQADFMNISFSGKGLTVNLSPQDPQTLPMLYPRALPNDQSSVWDFSQWQADVVVLDAGGNDLEGDPSNPNAAHLADTAKFVQAYTGMLTLIRQHHPKAHIVCVLTSAAQDAERTILTDAINQAIAAAAQAGDTNIAFFDYFNGDPVNHCYADAVTNEHLTYGCDYHPSRAGSAFLAARLAAAIKQQMSW